MKRDKIHPNCITCCYSRRTSTYIEQMHINALDVAASPSSRAEHHKSERSIFIRGRERTRKRKKREKKRKRVALRCNVTQRIDQRGVSEHGQLSKIRAGCRLWELMGRRRHSLLLRISLILTELALASTSSATPVLFSFPASPLASPRAPPCWS